MLTEDKLVDQIDIRQLQVGIHSLLLHFIHSKFYFFAKNCGFVLSLKGSCSIHGYATMTVAYTCFIRDLLKINPRMIHDVLKAQSRILQDLAKHAKWQKLKDTDGF